MAIGDTVQAGLMRIDTSAYERAGQANANANMAFGNALNQVAKGFIEGREKRARAEEMTGYLMNQGVSEKDAKAIAKNPFLQKEYQRKKGAERQMEMEGNRIAAQQSIAAADRRSQARIASDKAAQIQSEKDLIRAEADELKQITSEANQFMRTRPQTETPEFSNLLEQFSPDQIPGTPEFEAKELSEPMGARPPLMASFATDKPNFEMFNVGKAPIEQQLPESFQGQAGRIIDMADNGEISQPAADLALNRIQAQAMAEQKAGPTRSEDLAERKFQREVAKEEKEEIKQNKPKPPVYQERTLVAIDDALNVLNKDSFRFPVSGFLATTASEIGGTDSANLAQAITTIQSSIGFDRLQKMRDDSPTGGALGQVSERELSLLNSSLGSLSQMQGEEQLRTNLERVRTHYDNFIKSINARNSGMSADTIKNGYLALNQSNQSAPASQATLDALEKAKQLRDNRAMMQQTLDNPSIPNYGPQ